jgi:hypothetical protein
MRVNTSEPVEVGVNGGVMKVKFLVVTLTGWNRPAESVRVEGPERFDPQTVNCVGTPTVTHEFDTSRITGAVCACPDDRSTRPRTNAASNADAIRRTLVTGGEDRLSRESLPCQSGIRVGESEHGPPRGCDWRGRAGHAHTGDTRRSPPIRGHPGDRM